MKLKKRMDRQASEKIAYTLLQVRSVWRLLFVSAFIKVILLPIAKLFFCDIMG